MDEVLFLCSCYKLKNLRLTTKVNTDTIQWLCISYLGGLVLERDDTSLNHLVVEIVALAGPLSHTGEDRVSSVGLGDVVDQLHDEDSLADAGAAEEADLASLGVGG